MGTKICLAWAVEPFVTSKTMYIIPYEPFVKKIPTLILT